MSDIDKDNPIVICGCCAREFEGFAPTQAHDCAADIGPTGITGHYGSAVADMSHFRFAAGHPPAELKIGTQICDPCIEALIASGVLEAECEDRPAFGTLQPIDLSDFDLVEIEGPNTPEKPQ